MIIPATQIRVGMLINYQNELHRVTSVVHVTPGNWRGMVQTKMRNLRSGTQTENRFRSEDKVDRINLEQHEMEFLYRSDDHYYFMNTENYEQTHLTRDILGDSVEYLTPNLQIKVEFFDGKAVGIELPQTVILTAWACWRRSSGRDRRRRSCSPEGRSSRPCSCAAASSARRCRPAAAESHS